MVEYLFITSNTHKVEEVRKYIPKVKQLNIELREIRSDSFEEVAKAKLEEAMRKTGIKDAVILVEDAGLEIEALNRFPGTYSAWIYKKIGCEGILRLMKGEKNRKARFIAVVAAYLPNTGKIVMARGEVEGKIAEEMRGGKGFGYDPIFIPLNYNTTFAENEEIKNKVSHRRQAWENIIKILKEHY